MFHFNARSGIVLPVTAVLFAAVAAYGATLDTLSFDQKLRLAKAGDEEAQIALARAYESGADVAVDKAEAANWYRKAADQGNPEAMYGLGRIISKGAPGVEKSPELAAKLYEAAARQGHVDAQNWLGYCYEHGLGIQQNDAGAIEWYTKAADAGLPAAQNNLGLMYLTGKGVTRDYGKAVGLFEQAANDGDAWGANNLGGLYEMGWGVSQDRQKALTYYNQASAKGNKHAGENFKRLAAVLGSVTTAAGADATAAGSAPKKTGNRAEPSASAAAKDDFRPAPPPSKPQAATVTEHPSAPKHKKASPAESRTNIKRQAISGGGQMPARRNSSQSTSKDSANCRSSLFGDLLAGLHLCD